MTAINSDLDTMTKTDAVLDIPLSVFVAVTTMEYRLLCCSVNALSTSLDGSLVEETCSNLVRVDAFFRYIAQPYARLDREMLIPLFVSQVDRYASDESFRVLLREIATDEPPAILTKGA
jgi:hypothetical protein